MPSVTDQIREILAEHARMPVDPATLSDNDDLYDSGMTSHASVQVMLGRSEGCFAMPKTSQWAVMRKLAGGRMIYADKLA